MIVRIPDCMGGSWLVWYEIDHTIEQEGYFFLSLFWFVSLPVLLGYKLAKYLLKKGNRE